MRPLTRLLPFLALAALPGSALAQASGLSATCPKLPVPFGPGEVATYLVEIGPFNGEGELRVAAVDTLRGARAYRLELKANVPLPLGKLDYDYQSWLDTEALVSRRHVRDYIEWRTERKRFYEIYPEDKTWRNTLNGESGTVASSCPLDDLSFIYFLRAQPLIPGETLTLNRYFKDEGNPVRVEVVRKDQMRVPAGTFNTIVVRPTIKTSGLFSEGGRAEIHVSDDQYRDMVYLRIEIPVAGSMTMKLKEVRRGTPLPR